MATPSQGPPPAGPAGGVDEMGVQIKSMGLKVHYTFDHAGQEKCLARWPQTLHVQTIPIDDRTSIGVVDLRTCLQCVSNCSPELVSEPDKDYTVYAFDYSEPDTPLVGQGMLSWGLGPSDPTQPQMVTGRVSRNMLAIFGNGVKETLEVRLKLTAVAKPPRNQAAPAPAPTPVPAPTPQALTPTQAPGQVYTQPHAPQPIPAPEPSYQSLRPATTTPSEASEWNSFIQSNPNFGHPTNGSTASSPALAPARPFNSSYEARSDVTNMYQGQQPAMSSRPASADPSIAPKRISGAPPPLLPAPEKPTASAEGSPIIGPVTHETKLPSRPSSRSSKRKPTGRPRGRPPKRPQQADGSTSGYEDGTDVEEPASKKRITTTKVERSNTATFGSAPDSLRVAASTAGSLRNFRPIGAQVEASAGSHLQEIPRAPTPVPGGRLPNHSQQRAAPSLLRRESSNAQGPESSFTSSYMEPNRSMSHNADTRSTMDSVAPSPAQTYSDGPSPTDITSSPPVPRSVRYDVQSSPPPSSPILPPMPRPTKQPDSGYMSGGLDSQHGNEDAAKKQVSTASNAAGSAKPKPKPKPRKSRAKKQPATSPNATDAAQSGQATQAQAQQTEQQNLVIHTETPGPPELLPQTSIYKPPNGQSRKAQRQSHTPIEPPSYPASQSMVPTPHDSHFGSAQQPSGPPPSWSQPPQYMSQPEHGAANPDPSEASPPNEESVKPPSPSEGTKTASPGDLAMDMNTERAGTDRGSVMSPEDGDARVHFEPGLQGPGHEFSDDHQQYLDSLGLGDHTFTPAEGAWTPNDVRAASAENAPAQTPSQMDPPPSRARTQEVSAEPELPSIPASDPVLPQLTLPMPQPEPSSHPQTDAPVPSENTRQNKNAVKKLAITQKLEEAIAAGLVPIFCKNCGAVRTPTWRKIWKQEHKGVPAYHEYSEKPGCVTAITILEKDEDGKPTSYEVTKKALGPNENKSDWTEVILCNPCGIWFSKWKSHRPAEKWENDEKRLGQVRKKRAGGAAASRSKKARTKNDAQPNLISEAGPLTDPIGPSEVGKSPEDSLPDPFVTQSQQESAASEKTTANGKGPQSRAGPGSAQSGGSGRSGDSGDARTPTGQGDEMGSTRRLLFPSPRKDGEAKILGEVAVNIVQTSPDMGLNKDVSSEGKENSGSSLQNDLADLFGTPPARPSTPPPKSANAGPGPFKTPTRPTPSHRIMTRSLTKSKRSTKSIRSPGDNLAVERTPTRTPRSRRRSPRNNEQPPELHDDFFMTPFAKSLQTLLSEADSFVQQPPTPNRNNGEFHLDLSTLTDDMSMHDGGFDFGNLLSTDNIMPSSPPVPRIGGGRGVSFAASLTYDHPGHAWPHFYSSADNGAGGQRQ